ncbi:MAG: DUF5615 family PIN-like protein [Chthoniobacterales bacterium]
MLDEGLPRSTVALLELAGEDAVHVGDLAMGAASDAEILGYSGDSNRIVVTLDADFHALLALSGFGKPSVLRIREEGLKAPWLCRLIIAVGRHFSSELETGCVMTFQGGRVRFRKLPMP